MELEWFSYIIGIIVGTVGSLAGSIGYREWQYRTNRRSRYDS